MIATGSIAQFITETQYEHIPGQLVDSPQGPSLRVGEPIIYPQTGTVEGALVYEVRMQSIAFGHPVQDADSRYVRVLYSSSGEDGLTTIRIPADGEAAGDPDSKLKARADIPAGPLRET